MGLFPESACEGFFVKKHLQNYVSHRLIYIFTSSHLHLHIFTSAHPHSHLYLCSSSYIHSQLHIYISAHLHILTSTSHIFIPLIYISHLHLSLFLTFSLKAGGSTAGAPRNATLCGDRACRVREMQARVRFVSVRRNPLRDCGLCSATAVRGAICGAGS